MTNDLATSDFVKIGVGAAMMGVWVTMVALNVPHAEDIVSFCKLGLTGLSAHYLTNYGTSTPTTVINTGGAK